LTSAMESPPDLILMDIRMPDMDGYEVCRKLKACKKTRQVPVIFLSVLSNLKDKMDAFTTGGVDYINKPFQEEEVLARVATHLSLRNAQSMLERQNYQLNQEIEERKRIEAELRQRSSQLQGLTVRLAEIQETERRHLARELHDRVGQNLTLLGIHLKILEDRLPEENMDFRRLTDSRQILEEMTESIRGMVGELRPFVLDDYGLMPALRWYGKLFSQRTGIPVSLSGNQSIRFPVKAETAFFRIAQESLTNVAKHARAGSVNISLHKNDNQWCLKIADDGVGFIPEKIKSPGLGLVAMKERLSTIDGSLRIDSNHGIGTTIIAEFPLSIKI